MSHHTALHRRAEPAVEQPTIEQAGGRISTSVDKTDDKGKPLNFRAKAGFRDHDGQLRPVAAYGRTSSAAERALLKLQDRSRNRRAGELTTLDKVSKAIEPQIDRAINETKPHAGAPPQEPAEASSPASNVRRSLGTSLSPVGSTARRDLGLTLRAARREAGMTRKAVADSLGWPQTKIELIEAGRIKVDHPLITDLIGAYGLTLQDSPNLASQLEAATESADADTLSWITSHVFRKTTATALDDSGQTARQIADHLGHAKISMTQDNYLDHQSTNPAAAEAPTSL
ncbi:helix-turn-helix domain-containing protein [Kribbella sp. CA-253562]|uniref:helix-turn-helix domain-containing protein n=1 Tax=Kribbella sp. CA-253562 TaxID=3239942 RepID=UPI003D929D71